MLDIFNDYVDGHFMWTVRNELEPRWNYIDSYDKGWIVNGSDGLNSFRSSWRDEADFERKHQDLKQKAFFRPSIFQ